jgi:hypothetical protein
MHVPCRVGQLARVDVAVWDERFALPHWDGTYQ